MANLFLEVFKSFQNSSFSALVHLTLKDQFQWLAYYVATSLYSTTMLQSHDAVNIDVVVNYTNMCFFVSDLILLQDFNISELF